jgi:hypothetical protein
VVLEFELIALARQWLYHLSHAPSTFCFGYFFFFNRILLLCLGQTGPQSYLQFPHSWNDRYETSHQLFIGWDGVLWTFYLVWPQTTICPLSASQVVRIMGMSQES